MARRGPNKHIIYALVDPRNQRIRYIGKTSNAERRLYEHIAEGRRPSTHRTRWINQLTRAGIEPILIELEEVTQENWQERERFWIQHYKQEGHSLTNGTDGGDGIVNPSVELRSKRSQYRKSAIDRMRRLLGEEGLCQMMADVRSTAHAPAARAKRSKALQKRWAKLTPAERRMKNQSIWTSKARQKASASHKARWANFTPDEREAAHLPTRSQQAREKRAATMRQRWQDMSEEAQRQYMMARFHNPSARAKAAKSRREYLASLSPAERRMRIAPMFTPEALAKRGATFSAMLQAKTPEEREAWMAQCRTPEARQKAGESIRKVRWEGKTVEERSAELAYLQTEEVNARRSQTVKEQLSKLSVEEKKARTAAANSDEQKARKAEQMRAMRDNAQIQKKKGAALKQTLQAKSAEQKAAEKKQRWETIRARYRQPDGTMAVEGVSILTLRQVLKERQIPHLASINKKDAVALLHEHGIDSLPIISD